VAAPDLPGLRPPPAPPTVRLAVTALAEFARCPRRHWFTGPLGLQEPRGERGDDDPDRATERGTLAHALLSEVDLLAPPLVRRALLAASVTRRGRDPADPGPRRILRDVERFLDGDGGRRLSAWARAGVLRREVPFLLRLGGPGAPACYLDGAMDALAEDGAEVRVVDFKYAMPGPGSADRYRLQLLAYALAAGRAFPGRTVRAELWFLRGGGGAADVSPTAEELSRFEAEAPRLAQGERAGLGRDASPTSLGRDEDRCRAEGCGWVARCFPPADRGVV
jgi:hypothetical protein